MNSERGMVLMPMIEKLNQYIVDALEVETSIIKVVASLGPVKGSQEQAIEDGRQILIADGSVVSIGEAERCLEIIDRFERIAIDAEKTRPTLARLLATVSGYAWDVVSDDEYLDRLSDDEYLRVVKVVKEATSVVDQSWYERSQTLNAIERMVEIALTGEPLSIDDWEGREAE